MAQSAGSEKIFLNALNRLTMLGSRRITALLNHYGSAEQAWNAPAEEYPLVLNLKQDSEQLKKEKEKVDPDREWRQLEKLKIGCLMADDSNYPGLLREIAYPPPIIYFKGDPIKIGDPAVAIVGSRRSTFYGTEVAKRLAQELAVAGITVVSGMALGIDTAAHRGALEQGGYTAAVLGCGLDKCYPRQNFELIEAIIESGVVFSEFPYGTEPLPINFPQRNRIISGLSLGTVVVEATAKSGSLITAGYAIEQNREVFAVPGNIGSPYSRGCHRLIKEGAKLVESAADILAELYLESSGERQLAIDLPVIDLNEAEKRLLQMIPYQPLHIDDLIRLSELGAAAASALLLSLEIKKVIRQTPGKYFCRI